MGEAKRRREAFEQAIHKTTEELTDEGKLIMAGYAAYCLTVMPKDAGPVQIRECALAYFAGAQHLWASMVEFLEPGADVTDKDEERMEKIFVEMEEITSQLASAVYPTRGNA